METCIASVQDNTTPRRFQLNHGQRTRTFGRVDHQKEPQLKGKIIPWNNHSFLFQTMPNSYIMLNDPNNPVLCWVPFEQYYCRSEPVQSFNTRGGWRLLSAVSISPLRSLDRLDLCPSHKDCWEFQHSDFHWSDLPSLIRSTILTVDSISSVEDFSFHWATLIIFLPQEALYNNQMQYKCGAWWLIGRIDAFRPEGRGFKSHSRRHAATLGKSFTRSCLWGLGLKLRHSRPIRAVSGAALSSSELEEALKKIVWMSEWNVSAYDTIYDTAS